MAYAGYWGPEAVFWTTSGTPARNTSVSVKVFGSETLATLYTDETKSSTAPNPLTTDTRGNLFFFADPGKYSIEVSGAQDALTIVVPTHPLDPDAPHGHAQADIVGLAATLATKVSDGELFLNVKDYGAVGDGTTDDTVAIQAALTAIPTGGATVYFPSGTYLVSIANGDNVNKLALRLTKTGVTLRGAGRGSTTIKLANSVGDYTAILSDNTALGTTDLSGLTIQDLTFDQNSANNVVGNIAQFTGQPRFVLRWQVGHRLVVDHCRFTNTDNINTIYANGSGVQHVSVRDCIFDNVGAHSPKHDHSAVYTHGSKVDIVGNTFVGGGISATTAIETHGATQTVRGNRIDNFFCMINVTGVSASSIGGIVEGNVGRNVGTGIVFWSRTYTGNTSGFGMEDFIVQGNTIELDFDAWAAVPSHRCGISLDILGTLPVHNVFIRNNIIRYKAFSTVPTASDNLSAGIQWYRLNPLTGSDLNVDISDNFIERPPAAGLYVNPNSTASKRFSINRNLILNPGEGNSPNFTNNFKAGMLLIGTFEDISITRNRMIDDRGTHIMSAGVDASLATSIVNGEHKDNNIRVADGVAIPAFSSAAAATWNQGLNAITGLFTATRYYTAPSSGRTTASLAAGTVCAHPFWVGQTTSFDRIGANVTTNVAATTVLLGIYADNGRGSPGARIIDAGTIDSSTTGAKELTISRLLLPGLYWLACAPLGGAPTLQAFNGQLYPVGVGSLATAVGAGGNTSGVITAAGAVTVSLPDPFPAIAGYQAFSPVIALRAA